MKKWSRNAFVKVPGFISIESLCARGVIFWSGIFNVLRYRFVFTTNGPTYKFCTILATFLLHFTKPFDT